MAVMVVTPVWPFSLGLLGRAEEGLNGFRVRTEVAMEHVVNECKVAWPVTGDVLDIHVGEEPGIGNQEQASAPSAPEQRHDVSPRR